MKPAWMSYIKKIMWRYPKNYRRENEAIEAATERPDFVDLVYFTKDLSYPEALKAFNMTDDEAQELLESYAYKIAKKLHLPMEDKKA